MTANTQQSGDSNQSPQQPEQRSAGSVNSVSSVGLLDSVLELGNTLTLRDALAAWQHEQDRLLNRSWRRPGGLARPAGL